MALAHFSILIHELLNKDPDIVPLEYPMIVFDIKSAMCMAKNGKDTKNTRHIARRMHFKGMDKSAICTILIGVREVCSWHTLIPRMLVSMIYQQE